MREIIRQRFYKGVVIFFMVWQMSLSVNGSNIMTTYSFSKHRQGKKLDEIEPIKIVEDIDSTIRCVGLCMRYGIRNGDEKKMKCTAVNFSTKKKICELLPERICDNNKYVLKDDEFFSYFDVEMDRSQISFLDSASCKQHGKCSGQCDKFDTTSTSAETSTLSTLSTATSTSTTSATTSAATSTTTLTTTSTPTSTTTSTTVTPSSTSTTTTEITTTPTESTSQTTTTSSATTELTTTAGTTHESTTTTSTSTEPITTTTEISSTAESSSLESTSLATTISTTPAEATELTTSTTTSPLTTATSPPTSLTTSTSSSTTITSTDFTTTPRPDCKGFYVIPPIDKCIFIISPNEECKDKGASGHLNAKTVEDLNEIISVLSAKVDGTDKPNIQIFIPIIKWNEGWFLNDLSSKSLPWVSTDRKEGYDCCIMNGGNDFRLVPIQCSEGGQYRQLCEIQY